jgi:hypothetical protein
MSSLKDDGVVVMIGKRGSGKSYLTKDLLYHKRDIPTGTVISGTEIANGFYGDFVPKIFIYEEYEESIMENLFKRQKKLLRKIQKGKKLDIRVFLIFDDCLDDNKGWKNSKYIRGVFMNGRHFKILYILIMQYPLGIGPNLRTNIDYVFILRDPIVSNRLRLYKNFAGMFPSFEIFCTTMDQCTENYECMVIDNTKKSNKLEDLVFWYKASGHEDFKLCSEEIWEYSRQMCIEDNSSSDDDDDDEHYNQNLSVDEYYNRYKRKGPDLSINKIF